MDAALYKGMAMVVVVVGGATRPYTSPQSRMYNPRQTYNVKNR